MKIILTTFQLFVNDNNLVSATKTNIFICLNILTGTFDFEFRYMNKIYHFVLLVTTFKKDDNISIISMMIFKEIKKSSNRKKTMKKSMKPKASTRNIPWAKSMNSPDGRQWQNMTLKSLETKTNHQIDNKWSHLNTRDMKKIIIFYALTLSVN